MKQIVITVFLAFGTISMAQDSIVSLDVLSAPQSPAANLMGFTESEILKPESPTDFMTNIKTASGGFSTVPNSLAMDFRLKNFLRPTENNSFSDYIRTTKEKDKSDVWNNVQQTAIVSIGYQNYSALNDSLRTGQGFGLGFKVSLLRGKELDVQFKQRYDSLMAMQSKLGLSGAALQKEWKATAEYQQLRLENIAAIKSGDTEKQKIIEAKIKEAQDAFVAKVNEANSTEYDKIKGVVEKMEFKTYGFVWDVAGGAVLNFPTNDFDYSIGGSSGLWTTVGYESKNGLSFLGLGRALYNANVSYTNTAGLLDTANVANYDFGARLLYEHPGKSFSLSAEGIYRGSFGNAYDPMYRLTFNVGYEIYRNMKLTFMFGRDYDGLVTREGTVISAIQLLAGFGSKKNLKR